MRWLWIGTLLFACADGTLDVAPTPVDARLADAAQPDAARDAAPLDQAPPDPSADAMLDVAIPPDAGVVDARVAVDAASPLTCDPGFEVAADQVAFRHPEPFVYVGVRLLGPGEARTEWVGVDRPDGDDGPYRWTWRLVDVGPGIWTVIFAHTVDDPEGRPDVEVARCQFRVGGVPPEMDPPDMDQPDGGPCTPSCAGVICGGPDGCGGACTGDRRGALGAAADCRGNGDCGCGARGQADNMSCRDDGRCLVRCECDCLPGGASIIDAVEVAGMTFDQSCSLALERSGDPTVWDYQRGVPLCPTGDLPDDAPNCGACPPCHRLEPPDCSQAAYCECVDPQYRSRYPRYDEVCGPPP